MTVYGYSVDIGAQDQPGSHPSSRVAFADVGVSSMIEGVQFGARWVGRTVAEFQNENPTAGRLDMPASADSLILGFTVERFTDDGTDIQLYGGARETAGWEWGAN